MKVIDILNSSQKPFASFELVPPLKGSDVSRLYDSIDPLMQFQPPFINITCHRDEVEYVPNGDGSYRKMTLAKRPSTIAIVAAIMRRYPNLEIVPHVICGGASQSRVESELLDLHCSTSISSASRMSLPCVVMPFPDSGSSFLNLMVSVTVLNSWP